MKAPWPKVRLGEVLTQYTEYIEAPGPRLYPKLSVKLYGRGVALDTPVDGTFLKMKRHQLAKAGQVILSEIWGKKGAIGFVPSEGEGALCTSHFFLFDVNETRLDRRWLQSLFTANYLEEQLGVEAKGTTGYAAVRPKTLLECKIPLPPLADQRRMVARIEELAAKIHNARDLRQQVSDETGRLLTIQFRKTIDDAPVRPMADIAPLVRRDVEIDLEAHYPELGIRSFGKGTFHKPPLAGVDVGSKRLYRIEPGDLLFSNVFAWEGAIAVAQPQDVGRFGSHRFITCVANPGITTADFLRYYFLTPEGLTKIGEASPGGAGRNRTLGLEKLMAIQVPVPSLAEQQAFSGLQAEVALIRSQHAEIREAARALLSSVLERTFREPAR